MLFYYSSSQNPYYNIALEEYLVISSCDSILLFYVNEPSVVCGRFQNINAEINHRFILENKIKLARRLSGGGTVYHDQGNLNFAFIGNNPSEIKDIVVYLSESIAALGCKDISIARNNLFINGFKISGTAVYKLGERFLFHGTLLVNSDLNSLHSSLSCNNSYFSRAVKSVPAKTTNLNFLVQNDFLEDKFISLLRERAQAFDCFELDQTENEKVLERACFFESDPWIFGNSPVYIFSNWSDDIKVFLKCERGRIVKSEMVINKIQYDVNCLTGTFHNYKGIQDVFGKTDHILNYNNNSLLLSFF